MSIEGEILAQMARSAEIDVELDKFAHKIAEEVRDLTPEFGDLPPKRGEPGIGDPGDAKAAIKVEHQAAKVPTRRVISRDPKAIWIELGTAHMPEYAPFAKVAALHGGTGPIIDEGVEHAQGKLREEVDKLAKMTAVGATAAELSAQRSAVGAARQARSSAFKAARGGRRRGRR